MGHWYTLKQQNNSQFPGSQGGFQDCYVGLDQNDSFIDINHCVEEMPHSNEETDSFEMDPRSVSMCWPLS